MSSGVLLDQLRVACSNLARNGSCEPDIIVKAEHLLEHENGSTGIRKLAAQLLHRSGRGRRNFLHLSVALDCEPLEFVAKVAKLWMKKNKHIQIGSDDDQFLFYSSLITRISKGKNELKKMLHNSEFLALRRGILFAALAILEMRDENCTQLLKAVVKLFDSDSDIEEIQDVCVNEMPSDMAGNLLLASILYNGRVIPTRHIDHWLSLMKKWAAEQEVASASSPLVNQLLSNKNEIPRIVDALVECILSSSSTVRVNSLRCWLARFPGLPGGMTVLHFIRSNLIIRWTERMNQPADSIWPPSIHETEDFSCVDPQWKWAESDGVTWLSDRILFAYIHIWAIIANKNGSQKPSADDDLILAALRWHDEEIRLEAFNLLVTMDDSNAIQEDFLLANHDAFSGDLKRLVRNRGSCFAFSKNGAAIWKTLKLNENGETEEKSRVFLPDSVDVPPLPDDSALPAFVDKLLADGGSHNENQVPSFPELYGNLDSVGMNHRVYAKLLTDSMDRMAIGNSLEAGDFLWKVVSRCRMKAVVDGGCSHLEVVIAKYKTQLPKKFFFKATSLLFSPSCSVRTLTLSRILWSCCENDQSLFSHLWQRIQQELVPSAEPSVLTRVLKTLKLFLAKSDCRFPAESVPILFFFCLDAQGYPDFLTRSSATIVFGFLLRSITSHRKQPLFSFIAKYRNLWNQMKSKLLALSSLPRQQRILLLTCLSRFIIYHNEFYALPELKNLSSLFEQLNIMRLKSPDVRERRFCIDVLIQLIPLQRHDSLKTNIQGSVHSCNSSADYEYFIHRTTSALTEPSLPEVKLSEYFKRIDDVVESQVLSQLAKLEEDVDLDNELSAQGYVMALIRLAEKNKDFKPSEVSSICSVASSLVDHPFSRVRSLVSRIPVALGLSKLFLHGKYLKDLLSC